VIVDDSLDLSTLPSTASFSIVDRPDGTKQLKAGKWPLYYFSGDTAAGETNGQGSGGVWFVVAPNATLIK
jgi:predicted lipoprotein with Yx(FWY)xxD motif